MEQREILAGVRLLALDVDGVLTNGDIVYGDPGPLQGGVIELQSFHSFDGLVFEPLRDAGVTIAWITGRGCGATQRRAAELGVEELHMKSGPKDRVLEEIQQRLGIDVAHTIAMGDDLPDLAMADHAGLFAAPADARPEVRERAGLVTTLGGGKGAVRELGEAILSAQGRWPPRAG